MPAELLILKVALVVIGKLTDQEEGSFMFGTKNQNIIIVVNAKASCFTNRVTWIVFVVNNRLFS
jgi:hypothetical protein